MRLGDFVMANLKKKLSSNIDGDFYVDSTCIDCDTCRQIAPETFKHEGDYSVVYQQPSSEKDIRSATQAIIACPTGSIGTEGKNLVKETIRDFPLNIIENVYYLGFNAESSFGANSYFVEHDDGNWMIDSPRWTNHLVKEIEKRGGLKYIFLTHKDDVADSDKYAEKFGAKRIIHEFDLGKLKVEEVMKGIEPINFHKDFLMIPVPGHTKGSCVLLYKNKYLFTGDHLAWDRYNNRLKAFRRACWYSWDEQIKSMSRLAEFSFEWILTGHGQRTHLPANEMKRGMVDLVAWMEGV